MDDNAEKRNSKPDTEQQKLFKLKHEEKKRLKKSTEATLHLGEYHIVCNWNPRKKEG